jgi:Cu/Ag efflux protein CusF
MKQLLTVGVAMIFVVSLAMVAIAADQVYSLKGPVLSVDSKAKTVTVHSIEGVTAAANNIWKGDVTFTTDKKTKISMHKKNKTFKAIKAGQEVEVMFHEKDGKHVADKIMISAEKKAK